MLLSGGIVWHLFVSMITLDSRTTALVLIDLQNGIVGRQLAPRQGTEAAAAGARLAERFREAGAPVVLVHVTWAMDFGDALRQPVDRPMPRPPGELPEGWSDFIPGLLQPSDIVVAKHQWGAFYGTDLDVQLRRRGIRTIVLGGIATNMGVESTARQAWERAYAVVVAEDTTASFTKEMHAFAIEEIFPRIARVTTAEEISLRGE